MKKMKLETILGRLKKEKFSVADQKKYPESTKFIDENIGGFLTFKDWDPRAFKDLLVENSVEIVINKNKETADPEEIFNKIRRK